MDRLQVKNTNGYGRCVAKGGKERWKEYFMSPPISLCPWVNEAWEMQMLAACRRATRQASIVYAGDSPSMSKKSVVLLCESKTYREIYTNSIETWWNIK